MLRHAIALCTCREVSDPLAWYGVLQKAKVSVSHFQTLLETLVCAQAFLEPCGCGQASLSDAGWMPCISLVMQFGDRTCAPGHRCSAVCFEE